MVQIIVEYNGTRSVCEVSASDGVEVLQSVIMSVTDVMPEEQQITGIGPGVLSPHADLNTLGLTPGQRVIVKRVSKAAQTPTHTTAAPTPQAQAPFTQQQAMQLAQQLQQLMLASGRGVAGPVSVANPTRGLPATPTPVTLPLQVDIQSTCSRVYIGDDAVPQPSLMAQGVPICYACAQTCHLPHHVTVRPRTDPITCQCSAISSSGHQCLFISRVTSGYDRLTGDFLSRTVTVLGHAAEAQAQQMLSQSSQQMRQRLLSYQQAALEYENKDWQARALTVIPVQTLQERAQKALAEARAAPPTDPPTHILSERDELCRQLLLWFKHEFFKWVNAPDCDTCGKPTTNIGGTAPNPEEQRFRAGMVELYRCNTCAAITRFPRYNHAAKLLETRRGRCGEWAQAFTLCCRALAFEARAANDWTDHVWTEVYSDDLNRWVHYDSCEAARDAPMLYEAGWGKKLNYVIAFSHEECVDVTRRYTQKWAQVLERRNLCTEAWLASQVATLNQARMSMLPVARQQQLRARAALEQQQLERHVTPATVATEQLKDDEKHGRITGSLEWRATRGELGAGNNASQLQQQLQQATKTVDGSSTTCTVPPSNSTVAPPAVTTTSTSTATTTTTTTTTTNTTTPATPTPSTSSTITTSTSTSTSTSIPAADKAVAARELAKQWFKAYHSQFSAGCGRSGCQNIYCKSSSAYMGGDLDATGVAKLCVELVTKHQNKHLCNLQSTT